MKHQSRHMIRFLIAFLLCASSLLAATGDIKWTRPRTNGWQLEICFEGMATNLTWNFGWLTNNQLAIGQIPAVQVQVTSLSYATNAAYPFVTATTRPRVIRGTKQLRNLAPNENTLDIVASGSDAIAGIALEDYIYASDSNILVTVLANTYGTNNLLLAQSATNGSLETFAKTLGKWTRQPFKAVRIDSNSYEITAVAWNRHAEQRKQIQFAQFWALDAHGHSYTQMVTRPTPYLDYIATIDASGFTQGDVITNYVRFFPWYGDTNSVCDFSDGVYAFETPYYHRAERFADQTNLYGHPVTVVNQATGSVSGLVVQMSAFNPNSPPTAYASIVLAASAMAKTNALYGHSNVTGTIYLQGTNSWIGTGDTAPSARPNTWLRIAKFPTHAPGTAAIVDGNGAGDIQDLVWLDEIKLTSKDAFTFSVCSNIWMNNCIFSTTNTDLIDGAGLHWVTGGSVDSVGFGQGFSGAPAGVQTWAEVWNVDIQGSVPKIHPYHVHDVYLHHTNSIASLISTAQTGLPFSPQEIMIYNNRFMNLHYNNNTFISMYAASLSCSNGAVYFQNISENPLPYGTGIGQILDIHSDLAANNITNIMYGASQSAGARIGYTYNKESTNVYWSVKGINKNSLDERLGIKGDTVAPQAKERIGNQSAMNGVGMSGAVTVNSTNKTEGGGQFEFYFRGVNSYQPTLTSLSPETGVPNPSLTTKYVNDASSYDWSVTGAGNGDYRLRNDSPFVLIPAAQVLSYDILHRPRGGYDHPGAYAYSPRFGGHFF